MLRKLRLSGILLILGLVVEALSLCWNNALSFMSFVVIGGALSLQARCYSSIRSFPPSLRPLPTSTPRRNFRLRGIGKGTTSVVPLIP